MMKNLRLMLAVGRRYPKGKGTKEYVWLHSHRIPAETLREPADSAARSDLGPAVNIAEWFAWAARCYHRTKLGNFVPGFHRWMARELEQLPGWGPHLWRPDSYRYDSARCIQFIRDFREEHGRLPPVSLNHESFSLDSTDYELCSGIARIAHNQDGGAGIKQISDVTMTNGLRTLAADYGYVWPKDRGPADWVARSKGGADLAYCGRKTIIMLMDDEFKALAAGGSADEIRRIYPGYETRKYKDQDWPQFLTDARMPFKKIAGSPPDF